MDADQDHGAVGQKAESDEGEDREDEERQKVSGEVQEEQHDGVLEERPEFKLHRRQHTEEIDG